MPTPEPADSAEVRRALGTVRTSARLPLAFGGVVVGGSELRMSELVGTATNSLRGLVVAEGRGLGGQAIAARRPVAVTDYHASDSISHHFDHAVRAEGVRSALAVPVIVRRSVRAVLYGAVREAVRFGDPAIDAVAQAARDLEQELAVRDEVERRLALLTAPQQLAGMAADSASAERETIRRGHAELRLLSREVTDEALRERIDAVTATLAEAATPPDGAAPSLSVRELDVLACVAAGQTNAEIATTLSIGAETVKSYLRGAMCKLDCHTRLQAVNAARRAGLLP
ncbi:LuxR C-terminal-related transcriptional regulator [Amycolatopsis sp. NPDC059027]|uniref:LuxR C-terminal-related transcriptional regulator n=1 Tax=Amycolatopsis sp. NPDC059027 TaxID=3346709 RepID=UPI00367349B0